MQILVLAFFCLTAILPDTQQQAAWKEFASVEGRFSATMPDHIKTSTLFTDTAEGRLLTRTVSATDTDLNEYLVSWTEYRQESIEQRASEKTFNKLRDALVLSKSGKVISESATIVERHAGRAITFSTPDGGIVEVRFYFVKNRFYQVMAQTKGRDSGAVERFFKSFTLLSGTPV